MEHVRPFKEECQFWYSSWCDAGRPRNGFLFDRMRHSKRQYMYAIRRIKRRQNEMKALKMLDAISVSNSRDLFAEAEKLNPKPSQARRIDDIDRDDGIAELFHEKYERLYNSVHSDEEEMQRIRQQVGVEARSSPLSVAEVSVLDVAVAVKKLKQMKHDGDHGFMSNHLIHGRQPFFREISQMMTAMFVHGVQPDDLLKASIVSIPKNLNKSLSDSSNYRGIALCSSLSKIVDLVILRRNSAALWTSDLQFAFKE